VTLDPTAGAAHRMVSVAALYDGRSVRDPVAMVLQDCANGHWDGAGTWKG